MKTFIFIDLLRVGIDLGQKYGRIVIAPQNDTNGDHVNHGQNVNARHAEEQTRHEEHASGEESEEGPGAAADVEGRPGAEVFAAAVAPDAAAGVGHVEGELRAADELLVFGDGLQRGGVCAPPVLVGVEAAALEFGLEAVDLDGVRHFGVVLGVLLKCLVELGSSLGETKMFAILIDKYSFI